MWIDKALSSLRNGTFGFTEAHEPCVLLGLVLGCTECILWTTRVGLCSRLGFSLTLYSILNFFQKPIRVKVVYRKKCVINRFLSVFNVAGAFFFPSHIMDRVSVRG